MRALIVLFSNGLGVLVLVSVLVLVLVRVRVKERIILPPGYMIGQGSGPGQGVVTCGGGGNSLLTPPQKKKLIGAGVSKF